MLIDLRIKSRKKKITNRKISYQRLAIQIRNISYGELVLENANNRNTSKRKMDRARRQMTRKEEKDGRTNNKKD